MKKKESKEVENPLMFGILLFLFLVSVIVIIFNVQKPSLDDDLTVKESESKLLEKEIPEGSLQDYYAKPPSSISGDETSDNVYLQTDPFRETCGNSDAGENPSITFGTVCL